jgi:hypothetical protein
MNLLRQIRESLSTIVRRANGRRFAEKFSANGMPSGGINPATNPLEEFFDSHTEGPGLHKWRHYFEPYHRHLSRFCGTQCAMLEIGVYGGGGLSMWRDYLGKGARIFGVDIDPTCKRLEKDGTKIFIGDQANPDFWNAFLKEAPEFDIVLDDGGHTPRQQITTLEWLLPAVKPGGVFVCEDIHGTDQGFSAYLSALVQCLHDVPPGGYHNDEGTFSLTSGFQSAIESIHSYPFMTVIEKRKRKLEVFNCQKHGTEWPNH